MAAQRLETAHYTIHFSAEPAQAAEVAAAVEGLYRAYVDLLGARHEQAPAKLELVLYKDRQQFQASNRSRPWAEAYYLAPRSHAYYAHGQNPHHWMLHEATHQLMREVSGFKRAKWSDEGLAAYLGASRLVDGDLLPGSIDPNAYPIWWLAGYELSGNLAQDISANRFIPLQELLTDTGPGIDQHVNAYYVHYWSLTHFLLHHGEGRHADGYRQLLADGASIERFRELIGPVHQVEIEWYAYLEQQIRAARVRERLQ